MAMDDFSLERLMKSRRWTFGNASTGKVYAQTLILSSGGKLQGYADPNESAWRVKDGAVEFLTQNGTVSARFDVIRSVDSQMEMEGRFRLSGPGQLYYLRENGELKFSKQRTALVVPIHDAYFIYGINLLYQSVGSDYEIVFVFSNETDRRAFAEMHQPSLFLSYHAIVLDDHLPGAALHAVSERKVWPTVKKFLALSLIHKNYDYILCVDAETFILRATGWTEAAADIVAKARWYGGGLGDDRVLERQIMHASSMALAPLEDYEKIRLISGDWRIYPWWWDLPVYDAKSVPGFLQWIDWSTRLHFVERLGWGVFDHITYQIYMCLYGGFTLNLVNGVTHSLEFSNADLVGRVHRDVSSVRWTNAFAYSQAPGFFRENGFLAIYHIDRKTFPQYTPG